MEFAGMKTECGNYIIDSIIDVGPTILDADIKEELSDSDAYIPGEETHKHTNIKVNGIIKNNLDAPGTEEEFNDSNRDKTNNNSVTMVNITESRSVINTRSKQLKQRKITPSPSDDSLKCLHCEKHKSKGHKCRDLEERPYMCSACNKTYLTAKSLSSHMKRSCSGSRCGYTCHQCNRIFFSVSGLITHSKIHQDPVIQTETSASPANCQSDSNSSKNPQVHKRGTAKKNCYNCDICGKTFSIKYALTIHKMIHSSKPLELNDEVVHSDGEKTVSTPENDSIFMNEVKNVQVFPSVIRVMQEQKPPIADELEEKPLVIDEEDIKPVLIGGFATPMMTNGFKEKSLVIAGLEEKHLVIALQSPVVDETSSVKNNQITFQHSKIRQLLQEPTKSLHHDFKGTFYFTPLDSKSKTNKMYTIINNLNAVAQATKNGDSFDEKCMYICQLCKMGFYAYPLYIKHMQKHTEEKLFLCGVCGKGFQSPATLSVHLKVHSEDYQKFKCTICGAELSSLSKLTHHKVTSHMDRVFECDICGKGFFRSWHLKEHRANHKEDEAKECDVCGTYFSEIGSLRKHMWSHLKEARLGVKGPVTASKGVQNLQERAGDQSFPCDQCTKVYHSRNRLALHKRTHSREKLSKCQLCNKEFFSPSELNRHHRTHTGEKPFQCGECGKSFALATTLKDHIRSHTGEKPFKCFMCSKSYSSSSILGRHKLTHIGQRKFQCSMCDKSFLYNTSLQVHKRTHTGEKPFHCDICDKSFTMLCHYRVHARIHTGERPYQCTYCDKNFNNYGSHYKHIRKHPEYEENSTIENVDELNNVISMIGKDDMETEQIDEIS